MLQGGTWLENKYPGVRCDIPAHVYRRLRFRMHVVIASLTPRLESTFAPNTQWTEEYATGPEILK